MKLKVAILSFLMLVFAGSSLLANGDKNNGAAASANTAEVKFVAGQEGEYLFHVAYNNASGARFSLVVLDEDGNQIFQRWFNDKNFNKSVRLVDPENQFSKLTFIFRNFADNSVQRYEVNASNKMVEDIDVKEVR